MELTDYHNYTQLTAELDRLVREHPDLAKVYSLGQTVEGRELAVIQISRGVNQVQTTNNDNPMYVMEMLDPCTCLWFKINYIYRALHATKINFNAFIFQNLVK